MANPFANPSVLTALIREMDELQLKRRPLQSHAISALPKPKKQLYVTMLVAILINQNISKSQARLLNMLLDSMDLDLKPAQLYDEVTLLGKAELQAFCELCDEHALAPCFLMDILVLCRLDTSINHDQQRSIAELVSLLAIPEHTLSDILHLANEVISPQHLDLTFDEDNLDYGDDKLYIEFDYNLLKPWHEFSYQPLSIDNLQNDLTGGKWLVNSSIELNKDLNISEAKLVFNRKGNLKIIEGKLNIKNSYLQSAVIEQHASFTIKDSIVNDGKFNFPMNSYEEEDYFSITNSFFYNNKNTWFTDPLISSKANLNINNCIFKTENRCCLDVEESILKINNSKFFKCGFSKTTKNQGAIRIIDGRYLDCKNSNFEKNVSLSGKDIYISNEYYTFKISNCNFFSEEFKITDWDSFAKNGSSVFIENIMNTQNNYVSIQNCMFKNSSIYTKARDNFHKIIFNSTLKNSPVYSNKNKEQVFENCNFDNNGKPNLIQMQD